MNNMEVRSINIDYTEQEGHLCGRAICFNEISEVLYDAEKHRFFREVIRPEAVTDELLANSDIRMLYNHNKDQILARNRKGTGTLKVERRDDGVWFDFEIPNTTLGHDTAELIKRGDISGCSFAFTDEGCTWDFSDKNMPLRMVNHITGIWDLSCVVNPAYAQTSVTARSIEEAEAASKPETPEQTEINNHEDESYKDEIASYKKIIDEL